jgi:hypothetical protein
MSYYSAPVSYGAYDPYAGTQSYLNSAPIAAPTYISAPTSYAAPPQFVSAPVPVPVYDTQPPLTVDQQIAKFATVIAATSRLLSPEANPFIRQVKIVTLEKETTKTSVPVYAQQVIGGIPQTYLTHQEVSQTNPKLESYFVEVDEPRQLPTGQWISAKTKVEKFRPKIQVHGTVYKLNGVPKGADPLEFAADEGALLSDTFLKALQECKDAPQDLKKAENVVWGPKTT